MTTMHDVARLAKVSTKTVSNAINDYPFMSAATKKRVMDAIEELGYRPNLSARSLRSGRSDIISLMIPDLRNAYFAELADSVMRAADAQKLSVIIQQTEGDRDRELALLRNVKAHMADGILLSAHGLRQEDSVLLNEIPTPMVLLGERILQAPGDHVAMNDIEGSKAATAHLIGLGCTRILAFGASGQPEGTAALRLAGYVEALQEAGMAVDESLIIGIDPWFRFTGAAAMRHVLEAGISFDGVVAFNDAVALGAMRIMQDAGIKIPEDVAIIGFDDIDETQYSLPTLSTIDPGRDEIAAVAVSYLKERIAAPKGSILPRHYLSRFELRPRESSTFVPRQAQDAALAVPPA